MKISWQTIEADPQYQSLSIEDQGIVKSEWFKDNISNTADFKKLSDQDRLYVINGFFANDISDPNPEGSIWGDIPKSLVRGLDSVGESIGGVMEMAHIPGGTWVKELYQQRGARPEIQKPEYLQDGTVIEHPERLADPRWWVNLVGENLPNLATMMAPGAGAYKFGKAAKLSAKAVKRLATGGAVAGGFTVEAGAAYNDAKDEMLKMGYDEKTAQGIATLEGVIVGTVNSLLEAVPFHVLLKNPGAKKGFARMVRQALFEGGTEMVQENVNMVAAELGHKPDRKWKEWVGRTIESGLGGAVIGGGLGIFGGGEAVQDKKRIEETTEQKKEGADLYKEKIVDALKAGNITIDELQEQKIKGNFTPEQVAIFDDAIAEFQAGPVKGTEDPIQSFVGRIIAGEKMETPEDLQFYENNKDEIEKRLKDSMPQEEEGLFPSQTPEEQAEIEKEILRQRKAKRAPTGEVSGQKVDREKQQAEINQIKARRALQTLAPIWNSLGEQEKSVAAELILPKGMEIEEGRKAKEAISRALPEERIEAGRKLKEADRLGLKLDADERKRLEAMVAEPKQMKPEGKRAEIDYSELTKTGEWVEPSEPTQAKKREPEQPQDEVAETVPPKKTAQVIGLKTSEKDQRPKPYPFDQTVDEYLESEYQRYLNSKPLGKETDFKAWKASDRGKTAAMDHEMAVRDAVKRGVTVRERVLKGYPGLSESKKLKSESQTDLSVTGELQKEPWEMTQKEFKRKVSSADHKIFSDIEIIDWGSRRGQGKRVGKIVKGAMSDAPQGKKTYIRIFAKLPDYNKHKIELEGMPLHETIPYLKARAAGFDHDTAMLNSYTDIDGHRQIVKNALDEGKPVPDAVIKEYPDLAPKEAVKLDEQTESAKIESMPKKEGPGKIPTKEQPRTSPPEKVGTKPPRAEKALVRVSHIDPQTMTAGKINKELDNLDKKQSKLINKFIKEGRGNEKYNDILKQKDQLSLDYTAVANRIYDLRQEIEARYGPKAPSRLPLRGFGSRKKQGGAPTPKKVDKKAAKLLDTLKDETGSSELANDIMRKAGDLIIDGVETFGRFRREMQKAFKEVWDKIRKHMRALWDVVNNQRGEISMWHGTPSGRIGGGKKGIHIGTWKAAKEALEARIGIPANGEWDGTRKYGETLLAGKKTLLKLDPDGYNQTGYNAVAPNKDYYPRGDAKYSDGTIVPLDSKPNILNVKISGRMTNTLQSPHSDIKANATMAAQIKRNRAKSGYYYINEGEDSGSISAVVPNEKHLEIIKDLLKNEIGSNELINDIAYKAVDIIRSGANTLEKFSRQMQAAFTDIWDKLKKHIKAIYESAKQVVANQRGSIPLKGIGEKKASKKTADDILKEIFAEPKVKKRVKEKKKFDKELRKDTEDVLKHVSNLKHIWKFIRPGKLTRQGKQDLSYMWDLMLSVPEFFKQKIGAVGRIYQAQQDRMDEYHEHIYQMENHDKINVVESLKRLKKDRIKARQVKKYLIDADRTGIGFHTKLEDKFWTVYNPKNEIVGEYESNITPDNVDRGETEAIAEMVKAEAEYLAEQGFTPEQIEAVTAFRLTTNKGFELLFRSMRNLMKKYKEAGLKEPELKTFEDGKPKTISLKEAMAIMGDMRGTYFPRIRQSGKYILTAIKGDDRILRTFKTPNMREYIKSKYEAQGYTVETKPSGQLGEDVFDLSGDLVKTQQIIMAAMEKAEKVLSGPWVEGKTELTEEIDKVTEEIQAVFLNAVSEQVANIIRGRGSRVHMTRRNPEVWKGYEEDPEIAIAKYIRGLSGGEAKRNASIKMLQALTGTDISFEDFQKIEKAKGNTVDRTDYMEFVRERMIDARQQKNAFKWAKAYISEMTRNREMADEVIGFVKGLAVGKYLAFRVFSAPLVNITALPTSVVATLKGAGISYRQAWRYTARALKTYRQYLQHKKGKFIPKEDQVIFKTIIEKGWDNPQFSSESMQTLRSQLGKTWDKVIDVGMWTFDQSERLNRVATIYAAYKGLKNIHKDKSASQLLDMAKELSDKSHGVYNKGNHPYVALGNNPAAKLAQMFYVFRTFSHTYLLNMKRLGLDKQWGAVAHMAVMPAVLAGAGASVMTPIISGLLKAFGLADEPEEEMYAKIAESFGPGAEAWARHGLVGLGGKGASIKGSLAIGIGDLPTKIEDLFGAPGSIGKDIYYGTKSLARGDVSKGLEKWSPTGIGNILRGYREYNEGLTTWNNAPKFYGTEPLKASKSEAFMRVFSLSPARLAGITEKQWKERRVEEKYRQWRTDIYAKIKRYILGDGDNEQWAKIIAEIIKFNEQAEKWRLSLITKRSIRTNIKRSFRPQRRERTR